MQLVGVRVLKEGMLEDEPLAFPHRTTGRAGRMTGFAEICSGQVDWRNRYE